MSIKYKKKMQDLVYELCLKEPELLQNDFLLYLEVIAYLRPDLRYMYFQDLMEHARENFLPAFETITRSRRFVQVYLLDQIEKQTFIDRYNNREEVLKWLGYKDIRES